MFNAPKKLDDFLFDAPWGFQRAVSMLQYYVGTKPTTLALLCFVVGESALILYWFNRDPIDFVGIWIMSLATFALITTAIQIETQQRVGVRNIARHWYFMPRLFVLCTGLAAAIVGLQYSLWPLGELPVIIGIYFMCCDSLPPQERYQWLRPRLARVPS